LAAGEDARARVCARAVAGDPFVRPGAACRTATLRGLRSTTVEVPRPAGAARRLLVDVELRAEANPARRSRLLQTTPLVAPWP
ncbi:MAG TPA: hypothetical protein VNJ53_00985, partial [Gaiellaceae bacterium]|nr:hypothetical protein [Gaiellaceae bacterium]